MLHQNSHRVISRLLRWVGLVALVLGAAFSHAKLAHIAAISAALATAKWFFAMTCCVIRLNGEPLESWQSRVGTWGTLQGASYAYFLECVCWLLDIIGEATVAKGASYRPEARQKALSDNFGKYISSLIIHSYALVSTSAFFSCHYWNEHCFHLILLRRSSWQRRKRVSWKRPRTWRRTWPQRTDVARRCFWLLGWEGQSCMTWGLQQLNCTCIYLNDWKEQNPIIVIMTRACFCLY